jgi:ribosomal protein S17
MPAREKIGVVVSNKMQKTVVVAVENRVAHPKYGKIVVKTKKFKAPRRGKPLSRRGSGAHRRNPSPQPYQTLAGG